MDKGGDKKIVHVRVIADRVIAEAVAQEVAASLEAKGYEVIEVTGMYPSQFNKTEGKVYLTVR